MLEHHLLGYDSGQDVQKLFGICELSTASSDCLSNASERLKAQDTRDTYIHCILCVLGSYVAYISVITLLGKREIVALLFFASRKHTHTIFTP